MDGGMDGWSGGLDGLVLSSVVIALQNTAHVLNIHTLIFSIDFFSSVFQIICCNFLLAKIERTAGDLASNLER